MRAIVPALAALLALGGQTAALPPPPPPPLAPPGSPSPFPSVLDTPRPSSRPPEVAAASAVLADLDSGQVLFDHRGSRRRPIASTTKVMTALLVLESATPFEEVVVSERAAAQTGASLGLAVGERIEVRELLYALMLQSANDAAVALAEHVAGSVERFVRRMNRRARALGLERTRFRSPNGLDDRGRSTARDLVAITEEAFRNETFARVVSTKRHVVDTGGGPVRRVQNRNALLWLYRGATGAKTGFTSAAGYCLVATAERRDLRLVAVVLGAPREAFHDAAALLNHGFRAFERRTLVEAGEELAPGMVEGRRLRVSIGESVEAVVRRGAEPEREVRLDADIRLPVREGEEVGRLVLTIDGDEIAEAPVLAVTSVQRPPPPPRAWWVRALTVLDGFMRTWLREAEI